MMQFDETDQSRLGQPKQLLLQLNGLTSSSISAEDIKLSVDKLTELSNMDNNGAGKKDHIPRPNQVRVDGAGNVSIIGSNNIVTVFDGKPVKNETPSLASLNMEQEMNRLATFKNWPHSAPVTANALARAGFFFLGIGDQVQCFACLGIIKDWEFGDHAMGEHKKHFPRCPFVRDPTYKNVPLVAEQAKSGAAGGAPAEKRAKEKAAELYKAPNNAKKSQSGKKGSGKPVKGGGFNESLKSCEGNPTRQPTIDSAETEVRLTFRSEYKRLLSYHSWPRNHPMDPRDLAKAGFYFLEKDDIVQCFACFGKIRDWEPQDIPRQEHTRHFPSCPFVKGLDVKNEPITDLQMANAVSIAYREPSGYENTLQQFSKQLEAALPQTAKVTSQWEQVASPNRVLNRPKYPDYAGENARVATYANGWPGILGITPQQLARAGFFYTGEGDSTKCFYCGGGLKHWESTDEPWTEHAKWFSVCEWLLQQRGRTFVSYVVRNFPVDTSQLRQARNTQSAAPTSAPAPAPTPAKAAKVATSPRPTASASQEPPEDEAGVIYKKFAKDDPLDEAMNSRLTKRVLEMGYDANLVKQVVRRQLRTAGKAFENTNDLLEAVWQAEELREAGKWEEDVEEEEVEEFRGGAKGGAEKFIAQVPEKRSKDAGRGEDELGVLTQKLEGMRVGEHQATATVGQTRVEPTEWQHQQTPEEIEREIERLRDEKLCKVCMDNDANTVLMPCTHLVVCDMCANSLRYCPICRQTITNVVKVFKS
ncbi:baculoviral IAP repeat-containing protein 3-like [Patiria miniata]|uniref:RING-type domain-containing protein n=1 Tax=Patiria miniata TaxID=46514 RepID=A0A914A5Q1_PATMI|nr:baculoviral IAP repeat-containing protein 3-like [Patiria miniata]